MVYSAVQINPLCTQGMKELYIVYVKIIARAFCTGMPGSGGQYSVMGRHQDPRTSMFGSSLNLNGKRYRVLIKYGVFF